ncbi:coiled-coil domain-containing protein [Paenibacillus alginolyticus]|uniref:Chromosome segregation ATPase n=1 Tax=Paenibacillus alginolyticus TaxID=59839 RepID=A0ABT4G795_9BACL|nr:chromosome segregation ATPase [Paenibacillus alginolyticus]MCY9692019.1 chromosome segregation ATPase [Paenibacillus alginolyticus]MEC0144209.1 chromosome segregation ATPase [Paenibacillus alginolyticus]
MPAISKIRFTNVVYEDGNKRYNDELFHFDGHNGAILLENGGGKTVFIQSAIQAILPHAELAGRKMKDTLSLENGPAHIAIEWILSERPRRYVVTCVSLFLTATGIDSYRYVYDYQELDADAIDRIPFVKESAGNLRAADKSEINDYYHQMTSKKMNAKLPPSIKEYKKILENDYHIIASEWDRIAKINSSEGGVESFFDECKTTSQLFDRLLIPTVEDAMAGYEQGEFANNFEMHRDSFKKYKELKEKIEENKKILVELDGYVRHFAKMDNKQMAYAAAQAETKAYWLLVNEQKNEESAKLSQWHHQMSECDQQSQVLARKKESLHIAKQKQEQSALETKLRLVEEDVELKETLVRSAKQHYYSLRLAEYRQQLTSAEERMNYLQRELDRFGNTEEEADLREAWLNNGGQIRSIYSQMEQEWQVEEEKLSQELAAYLNRTDLEETMLRELSSELEELNKQLIEHRSIVQAREKDKEALRANVLANPAVESMEGSMADWIQRYQKLDDSNVLLVQKNKDLAFGKEESERELEGVSESLKIAYVERASSEQNLEVFKKEHQSMLAEIAAYKSSWGRLSTVYEKQSSIEERLREDTEKQQLEKEAYLLKERLAFRYIDDYSYQDTFFADVYVAGLVDKWRNQFVLLETGIQYLQGLELTERAMTHPLWSVTLITTEGEVGVVASKLRQYAEDMQFPIQVISSQEAARLANSDTPAAVDDNAWVEPQHWRDNADEAEFVSWKQTISQKGEEVRTTRKAKEHNLQRTSDLQASFSRFIASYPLEVVQEMERQVGLHRERVRELESQVDAIRKSIRQVEQTIGQHNSVMDEQKGEIVQLQQWIEKGRKYVELGKEIDILNGGIDQLAEQSEDRQSKWESRQRSMEQVKLQIEDVKSRMNYLRTEKASLQSQDLYIELLDMQPIEANHSLDWLKTERKDLHLKINHISQGRQQLEAEWSHAKSSRTTLEKEMSKLRLEQADLELNEDLAFTVTGEEQMSQLLTELKEYESRLSRDKEEFVRVEKQFDALATRIKLLIEQFSAAHLGGLPLTFTESLSVVDEQVHSEETRLQQQKTGLLQQHAQIQAQLSKMEEVIQYLNQYKIMHGFENPLIQAAFIAQEQKAEFPFDRMKMVRTSVASLSAVMKELEVEESLVKKARLHFIDFCRKQIKDVKMRDMAEQGVEKKDNYQELTQFQQKMHSRIERVNHVAEETMRTHNQQLEQYIIHVHSHIKLIASELRDIPNKTRVKVEDQWKHIYSFQIPEWDELEAKDHLRKHLEWILAELEKGHYRDDNGQEVKSTVRKEIEKWLDTKQLLHIVLQERPMKVSCRKVTNENNVTKASFSWEQSNNWSGGEKWSKNMTLFLGLLNYVAEKRQHIQANMKRHRTVILDNPFGKASSDHVLSPVFFIAEQLGFQIIALTAHAEGKFLKDYFPVVFSCRLRQAANGSKLVMTKEKEINQAYFRDYAPISLERLGDVKQMELFI